MKTNNPIKNGYRTKQTLCEHEAQMTEKQVKIIHYP